MCLASFDYNIEMLSLGRLRLLNAVVTTLVLLCQYTAGTELESVGGSIAKNTNDTYLAFRLLEENGIAPGTAVQNMCVFDLVSVDWHVPFSLLRKNCDVDSKNSLTLNIVRGEQGVMYGSKKPINMKDDLDHNHEDTLTRDVFATHNLCNKKIEKLVEEENCLVRRNKDMFGKV